MSLPLLSLTDFPAAGADVDAGELLAAQPPQVLAVHDPSHGSQVRSCSREPPGGDQYLGLGQGAHHDSMGADGARWPPRQSGRRRPDGQTARQRPWGSLRTPPSVAAARAS
jgi:hypothetical protein